MDYEIDESNDKFFNIRNVELFQIKDKAKTIATDEKFVDKAIKMHNEEKEKNKYLPTVFI